MLFPDWSLSAAAALISLVAGVQGFSQYPGDVDPKNYMFYDASKDCSDSKRLCLTSMKFCSNEKDAKYAKCKDGAKKDDLSWAPGNPEYDIRWVVQELQGLRAVFTDLSGNINVTWVNNNPKYNTTLVWRAVNSQYFYMYQVVPAGQTSASFGLFSPEDSMQMGDYLPANDTDVDRVGYLVDLAKSGAAFEFTVGQPDDPAMKNAEDSSGNYLEPNATDTSSPFMMLDGAVADLANAQENLRGAEQEARDEAEKNKKVAIGVGVGVGVALIILSFFVGAWVGRKKGYKSVKQSAGSGT